MSISRRSLAVASFVVIALASLVVALVGPAGADIATADAGRTGPTPPTLIPAGSSFPRLGVTTRALAVPATPAPGTYAPKGRPPAGQAKSGPGLTAKADPAALTYLYGGVNQFTLADGMEARMTVARPALADEDFHSLAELAAQSADGRQIVEVGWTVDRSVNNGSTNPHLFVFHWVNGVPACYNGCGFVQYSATVKPGMALPTSGMQYFAIVAFEGNWWISYGGEWVGYFPGTLWGGGFTRIGLAQVFGEVAADSAEPCTDMGNGRFATRGNAAAITNIRYWNGPPVSLGITQTHPSLYTALPVGFSAARYGGPGAC